MRVLIVSDTYPPNVNGAAIATEKMAVQLAKKGHNVSVIAPSTEFNTSERTKKNLTIYRVRSIPVLIEKTQDFRVSPTPLHVREIKRIVEEVNPDLIHISEPLFMGLSAIGIAKDKNIPIVATHHFMPENIVHYLHLPFKLETVITSTIWKWYANVCRHLDLVICPTQAAADLIAKYNPHVELKVISNGIDLKLFKPENKGEYLKERFKLPNKPVLLYVGRIDKEKNLDVLIHAAALIKDKVNFHILIVGQGKEKRPLRDLTEELGLRSVITFTGYLPKKDLANIYKVGDIFVIPSIAELQSLVTMEAMATGLPVVGANAVALPHLIHHNKNGFLFEPGNSSQLADQLLKLIKGKELRSKMGRESLEIIKEHSVDKVVRIVEETYEGVIKNHSLKVKNVSRRNNVDVLQRLKKVAALKKVLPQQLETQ